MPASAQYVAANPVRARSLPRFAAFCIDARTAPPAINELVMIIVTSMALPRCALR
jgi:hypothetical protein